MAKKINWRFCLFLIGAAISCLIAIGEIALIALGYIGAIGWVTAALLGLGAILPAALFGAPYLNSRFYVSYSRQSGWRFGEERRKTPRASKTAERQDYAEWADDDDFTLPSTPQNNFINCEGCQ